MEKELILSSCGINIYEDKEFEKLSQQRCVEKIWNEKSPQMVAQLIEAMFDYFIYDIGIDTIVPKELERDFTMIRETIERLKKTDSVELPEVFDAGSLKTILEDKETNLKNSKPEMALDRLHTYTTEYFRSLCQKHELSIEDVKGINEILNRVEAEYVVHMVADTLKFIEKLEKIQG